MSVKNLSYLDNINVDHAEKVSDETSRLIFTEPATEIQVGVC
jgi:hypothetical protein